MKLIVIENTRSCVLKCECCPTVVAKSYPGGFMSMDVFYKVMDNVSSLYSNCVLSGWGEPFLDKNYFDKLSYLKAKGFKVGSTTNLLLLNKDIFEKLNSTGLDQLNVSLDFFHLRSAGVSLREMRNTIYDLLDLYVSHFFTFNVQFNVVITKSTVNNLSQILSLLLPYAEIIGQVNIMPLIMIPKEKLLLELLSKKELLDIKRNTIKKFKKLKCFFDYLEDKLVNNCRSNIFNNVYVTYTGQVAPCCMLAMEFPNYTFNHEHGYMHPVYFGDLTKTDLKTIWDSRPYQNFRETFAKGKIPNCCIACNVWRVLP